MPIIQDVTGIIDSILYHVRNWWRPLTCIAICGTMFVQGIVLPLMTKTFPDLMGLSALITSIAATFAVREWGKIKGSAK
jgi:hypothetical protein